MNARRDPERLIHAFLMEGQTELADQVYDAVRAEIERKRQRVVIGPWRMPTMNKFLPIGLGAAAVVAAFVVGAQLLGPPAPGGAGGASSTAPSPTPESSPSVASPSPSAAADLPEGPFAFFDGSAPDSRGPSISVTIPAPGWTVNEDGALVKDEGVDPPDGAFVFGPWVGEPLIPGDPCRWASTMPDTPATTVDEITAALASQASRDASAPVDVTVDGHAGKSITLQVPDDVAYAAGEFVDCNQGNFCTLAFEDGASCYMHNFSPDQVQEVWFADVDGEIVFVDGVYFSNTAPDVVEEVRAILGSMTFSE